MNIAVVGDIHLGINSENIDRVDKLSESQEIFFTDFLVPELRANNVSDVIFTGDVFDARRKIDSKVLQRAIELFKDVLHDFKCHIIIGNHDLYFKDSLEVTSLTALEPYCKVYKKTKKVTINDISFLMCPWVTEDAIDKHIDFIKKNGKHYDFVVGHFDMKGVPMVGGRPSEHGFDIELFSEYCNYTLSGHYHNVSMNGNGNVLYVGTPLQLNFGDRDQARGIWIIDSNKKPRFIENNKSFKFVKITSKEELTKFNSLEDYFVEFEIKSDSSNEEKFEFRKTIEVLKPLYLKGSVAPLEYSKIEAPTVVNTNTPDVFVELSKAANGGNFKEIVAIYMKIDKPENEKNVLELFEEIQLISEK